MKQGSDKMEQVNGQFRVSLEMKGSVLGASARNWLVYGRDYGLE